MYNTYIQMGTWCDQVQLLVPAKEMAFHLFTLFLTQIIETVDVIIW